jgi:hypothetical protein
MSKQEANMNDDDDRSIELSEDDLTPEARAILEAELERRGTGTIWDIVDEWLIEAGRAAGYTYTPKQ